MGARISGVTAREIFANRANLGLEVLIETDDGALGRSTPEAGVSTGEYEAHFVLDGDPSRYDGMGCRQAAENVNQIIGPALVGVDVTHQHEVDQIMLDLDGTPNKATLGANAIVGVSLAAMDAAAASSGLPLYRYIGGAQARVLPIPILGVGQGGRYRDPGKTRWLKPSYEFCPYGAGSFSNAHQVGHQIKKELNRILQARYGYEVRGYAGLNLTTVLKDDRELLEAMTEAIVRTGYEGQVGLYFDAAADCYYEPEVDRYVGIFGPGEKTRDEMLRYYLEIIDNFPIVSIEDPLHDDDFEGHALVTRETGIEIVGDDIFTTNVERLKQGIAVGACNSMVLKISQVGTVTEALEAARLCHFHGYNVHPCGSRGDRVSIADYAVGLNAGQVRGVDANRVLEIEEDMDDGFVWLGKAAYKGGRNS